MIEVFWLPPTDAGWAQVLNLAIAHDSYHLPSYHQLAETMREGEARLLVAREGNQFLALPLLLRSVSSVPGLEGSALLDATSVYGYPGPLVSRVAPSRDLTTQFGNHLRRHLVDAGVAAVFSRLNPLLEQAPWLAGLGSIVTHGATISLDLRLAPDLQRLGYRRNHRRDLKRLSEGGFTCSPDGSFGAWTGFVGMYHETMRRVGASPRYHFPTAYFTGLRTAIGAGAELLTCRRSGAVVAGAVFLRRGGIVQYHLGGTRGDWSQYAPLKLVFDTAQAYYHQRAAEVLHLGGGRGATEDSLFRFKAGFSERRHAFQTWRWVIMPDEYARLCAARGLDLEPPDRGFFPRYRITVSDEEPTPPGLPQEGEPDHPLHLFAEDEIAVARAVLHSGEIKD
jgi:Acetyltransferase (GNAT) domain